MPQFTTSAARALDLDQWRSILSVDEFETLLNQADNERKAHSIVCTAPPSPPVELFRIPRPVVGIALSALMGEKPSFGNLSGLLASLLSDDKALQPLLDDDLINGTLVLILSKALISLAVHSTHRHTRSRMSQRYHPKPGVDSEIDSYLRVQLLFVLVAH